MSFRAAGRSNVLGPATRVLWVSDSPDTPSGFGNVTRFVCEGLARRGHSVSILGWQTQELHDWRGCTVYPGRGNLGSEALLPLLLRVRPDIVISLADIWWLTYFCAPHVRRQMEMTETPWALYFPVDGDMADERLPTGWIDVLREVDIPIAMSRYGQRIAQRCGVPCEYIPHGVDLEIFAPPADRAAAKRLIGLEDKFIVLSDSRNQPRKMLPRLLDVFQRFAEGRPDVVLHLHTDPDDEFTRSGIYSYDLREDVGSLGLKAQVRFTPGLAMRQGGGVPLERLAAYYRAADVHLLASSGEGFGLPTLQAAAAGAVPMAGAYSASQELVEGHGEAIAIAGWTESEFGIRRGLIDVEDAAGKLARYYVDRGLLEERSRASRAFAEPYSWPVIIDAWNALVRSVDRRRLGQRRAAAARIGAGARQLFAPLGGLPPGVSVRVNVVGHACGRLESSILGDTRGRVSDVKIPTLPRPSVVGGVTVMRRAGRVCMAAGDALVFERLRRVFPVLSARVPQFGGARSRASGSDDAPIAALPLEEPEEARLELAQSILVLNTSGALPRDLLIDAALLGVPCVGTAAAAPQAMLWPLLVAEGAAEAVALARRLLTDAAFANRVAATALAACRALYDTDDEDVAGWLRRLFACEARERGPSPELAQG